MSRRRSSSEPVGIDHDDLWPRDAEHRYRVYAVVGRSMDVLAAAPDPGGVGQALISLHLDEKARGRRLCDLGRIGVLDTLEGDWVVLPWDRRSEAF